MKLIALLTSVAALALTVAVPDVVTAQEAEASGVRAVFAFPVR